MDVIFALLSLLGFSLFFASYFRVRLPIAFFSAIASVVLLLYLFGLAGLLRAGGLTSLFIGLGLLVFFLARYGRAIPAALRRLEFGQYCQLLYLIPFLFFAAQIPGDFRFTGWDEFSFWGAGIKIIHATDALYLKDSPLIDIFKAYPPVQQLFQYYLLFLEPWSERAVLLAQVIFMLSALACVVGAFHEKSSLLEALTFWAACGLLYFFGFDFKHVYVDPLLALVFAASLALAATVKGAKGAWLVAVSLALLVLVKQIGLILGFVVAAVYFLGNLVRDSDAEGFARLKRAVCRTLPGVMAIAAAFASWSWYSRKIGVVSSYAIPDLASWFVDPMWGRIGKTAAAFIQRSGADVFGLAQGGAWQIQLLLSVAGVIGWLLALSAICVLASNKRAMLDRAALFSMLALGSIGYLLFLFLSYLFFFTEYEGVRLASYERYAATYFLAWGVIAMAAYSGAVAAVRRIWLRMLLAVPVMLGFLCVPLALFSADAPSPAVSQVLEQREKVDGLVQVLSGAAKPGDKVYFISQNSSGFEKFMFGYSALPLETQWWCWSVGQKYNPEDVWTCNEKLETLLRGYSYVVLYNADAVFWENNAALFPAETRGAASGVYRIDGNGDSLVLKKVG